MTLSIIIVHYNAWSFLEQCIQSVVDACKSIDSEIIVVDNNSTNNYTSNLVLKFSNVKWIQNTKNIGFSKANNLGVSKSRGKYIVILNPDTVVEELTFEKLLAFIKTEENIGIVGVKLVDGSGEFLPESKRSIPTPLISLQKLFNVFNKSNGKYYASHLAMDESGYVDVLVGAFMFMKRSIYVEINGFDEDYFMYGEDIDLSYKVLKKGYKNYYFADTNIIHYKGECTIKDLKYLKHFNDAMKIFYQKHFKTNLVYDFCMGFGIKFWYLLKYFQLNNIKIETVKIDNFILISNCEKTFSRLNTTLKNEYAIRIQIEELKDVIIKENKFDTIIFDNNFISYHQIIKTIHKLRGGNIKFRCIPKKTNFIIGSDSSDTPGQTMFF